MSTTRQTEILEKCFDVDKLNVGISESVLPAGASTETTVKAILDITDECFDVDKINVGVAASVLPTGAATETSLYSALAIATAEYNAETDCNQTISVENLNIQQGKAFSVSGSFSIATSTTLKFTFQTNSTHRVRFKPTAIVSSADKMTYNAYEGSSGNSGGSTLTPINRNRNSDYETDVIVKSGVTVTTNGTLINTAYIPGATGIGGTRTGSETGDDYGWILKPNTLYTLEFINGSSATNIVSIHMLWFENTPT